MYKQRVRFDRRTTLKTLLSVPFVGVSMTNTAIRAQSPLNVQEEIGNATAEALQLMELALIIIEQEERSIRDNRDIREQLEEELRYLLVTDLQRRRTFVDRLQDISDDELRSGLSDSSESIVTFISNAGMSLVPDPELVQLEAPTILPPVSLHYSRRSRFDRQRA